MFARMTAMLVVFLFVASIAEAASPRVGSPAPAFSGTDLTGREISLASLRGNVVILNFWATWCGPCKEELPMLDAYMRAREKYGFRIVAVTTDANDVRPGIIQKLQDLLSFPLLKTFTGNYEPIKNAIPTNFIIDREGIVRYAAPGALTLEALNTILAPLLAEPPTGKAPVGKSPAITTSAPAPRLEAPPPN